MDESTLKLDLCPSCYKDLKEYWLNVKLKQDPKANKWSEVQSRVKVIGIGQACTGPKCTVFHEDGSHSHMHVRDPETCDCPDENDASIHRQILAHIHEIEKLYEELTVGRGVVSKLSTQVKEAKEVDPAVPTKFMSDGLESLSQLELELGLGDNKIETRAGRPLCVVWNEMKFHCHVDKMFRYSPTNCDCTKMACSCNHCILNHVEHCVEDYKDAVARVRLGITKLRNMPRTDGGFVTIRGNSTTTTSGNCAMPGVRKASHLKNYTKAQKDAHNRRG